MGGRPVSMGALRWLQDTTGPGRLCLDDLASPALVLALGGALLVGGRPAEALDGYERLRTRADLDTTDRVRTLRMLGKHSSSPPAMTKPPGRSSRLPSWGRESIGTVRSTPLDSSVLEI